MNTFDWLCAIFGLCFGFGVSGLIILDVYLVQTGQHTISRHVADYCVGHPFVCSVVIGALCLILGYTIGALTGHLFFAEKP